MSSIQSTTRKTSNLDDHSTYMDSLPERIEWGHQAGLLRDNLAMLDLDRRVAEARFKETLPDMATGGDDMGDIILGNQTITHPSPPAVMSPQPSMIPKLLLGAGLLATGIGAPAAVGIAVSALPGIISAMKPTTTLVEPKNPIVIPGERWDSKVDMIVEPPTMEGGH